MLCQQFVPREGLGSAVLSEVAVSLARREKRKSDIEAFFPSHSCPSLINFVLLPVVYFFVVCGCLSRFVCPAAKLASFPPTPHTYTSFIQCHKRVSDKKHMRLGRFGRG